ncbi:MAG: 16S rRNA (uracil(1498)-N(3))-methyltransferase [Pseudomonadota bacterium]
MRRFIVEEIGKETDHHAITGPEARHIAKVLRMAPGDRIILMDRQGVRFQAIITSTDPHRVTVTLERRLPKPIPSPVQITLCQSILKSRPMDYMIQKTSELGVDRIYPFTSERTVVRVDKGRMQSKIRHWREIGHSTTAQADRISPVEIGHLDDFQVLTARLKEEAGLKVILWEEEEAKELKSLLKSSERLKTFIGIVGPEGGFSREEVKLAREAGFASVSLGRRILRAETAATILVGIVQYEWGDLCLENIL